MKGIHGSAGQFGADSHGSDGRSTHKGQRGDARMCIVGVVVDVGCDVTIVVRILVVHSPAVGSRIVGVALEAFGPGDGDGSTRSIEGEVLQQAGIGSAVALDIYGIGSTRGEVGEGHGVGGDDEGGVAVGDRVVGSAGSGPSKGDCGGGHVASHDAIGAMAAGHALDVEVLDIDFAGAIPCGRHNLEGHIDAVVGGDAGDIVGSELVLGRFRTSDVDQRDVGSRVGRVGHDTGSHGRVVVPVGGSVEADIDIVTRGGDEGGSHHAGAAGGAIDGKAAISVGGIECAIAIVGLRSIPAERQGVVVVARIGEGVEVPRQRDSVARSDDGSVRSGSGVVVADAAHGQGIRSGGVEAGDGIRHRSDDGIEDHSGSAIDGDQPTAGGAVGVPVDGSAVGSDVANSDICGGRARGAGDGVGHTYKALGGSVAAVEGVARQAEDSEACLGDIAAQCPADFDGIALADRDTGHLIVARSEGSGTLEATVLIEADGVAVPAVAVAIYHFHNNIAGNITQGGGVDIDEVAGIAFTAVGSDANVIAVTRLEVVDGEGIVVGDIEDGAVEGDDPFGVIFAGGGPGHGDATVGSSGVDSDEVGDSRTGGAAHSDDDGVASGEIGASSSDYLRAGMVDLEGSFASKGARIPDQDNGVVLAHGELSGGGVARGDGGRC